MNNAGSSQLVLPKAFDTSLGTNFTQQSCPDFFSNFLKNDTFINCYPMSFFLKNSQSYVDVVRSGLVAVENVLNTSCSVDFGKCKTVMSELGHELISSANCATDYSLQNPLVIQAVNDFSAYNEVFQATCLKIPKDETEIVEQSGSSIRIETQNTSSTSSSASTDYSTFITTTSSNKSSGVAPTASVLEASTKNPQKRDTIPTTEPKLTFDNLETSLFDRSVQKATYCYSDALFSMVESSADDAYLYLLPLGINFPNTSTPSCSECTKQVMGIFHSFTSNASNVITLTYASAAKTVNRKCSDSFVNASILAQGNGSKSSGSHNIAVTPEPNIQLLSLMLIFLSLFSFHYVL